MPTTNIQISHEWAFCVVVLDLPKYMNDVLHFSIQDNGIYSSIPQVTKLIMALVTGALNDWLINSGRLSLTNGRKIFVAVGMCLMNYKLWFWRLISFLQPTLSKLGLHFAYFVGIKHFCFLLLLPIFTPSSICVYWHFYCGCIVCGMR